MGAQLAHYKNHDYLNLTRESEDNGYPLVWRSIVDPDELQLAKKLGVRMDEFLKDDTTWAGEVRGYYCYHCASGAMDCFNIIAHLENK